MRPALRERVVFAAHDLVNGASFNEFHAIVCRNVMIYFNAALQERVHGLLHGSLCAGGALGLGRRELLPAAFVPRYAPIDAAERLYRKVA